MQGKRRRQEALVQLLEEEAVANQKEVVDRMRARGFQLTQPSVSRDIRELGVVKLGGRYLLAHQATAARAAASNGSGRVLSVERAGPNLLVVRTEIGAANVMALGLDQDRPEGVIGTIAGDDTVFIATRNRAAQDGLVQRLTEAT